MRRISFSYYFHLAGTILVSCKVLCTRHMGALFQYLDLTKCATQVSVLRRNATKTQRREMFLCQAHTLFYCSNQSPTISELGEAAETIWRRVNMTIVKSSLCFTTIVHGSFMFSFKKKPIYLGISNAEGTKG